MTTQPTPEQYLREFADGIVFRCFAQGQYWGTGMDRDPEAFDEDYKPENPIDRGEAVKLLVDEFNRLLKLREQEAHSRGAKQASEFINMWLPGFNVRLSDISGASHDLSNYLGGLQDELERLTTPNNTSNTLEDEVTDGN